MTAAPIQLPEPSQATLRAARALQRRTERKETGLFLVEGRQAVREALAVPGVVQEVYFRWDAAIANADLFETARDADVPYYGVSEQNLATITDTVTPQGVVAVARTIDVPLSSVLGRKPVNPDKPKKKHRRRDVSLVVICAQVRDPGNAGTVIRCADAFGADAVILSSDSVEVYNPKTVRASVGSLFHLPIVVGVDLAEAIEACRKAGMQIFATDGSSGTDLTDLTDELGRPTAWVMGNESWGLPVEHLALADRTVAVPIYGHAESLNLATAAAVCLYASASAQRASN
ncbi:MAG: RNA methyltransferase [Propionicimonas sp.]|uniref:TrmH family RNA methyltransferase n=1 Tax=Propionicimonas sp. TaxID=1955623 RepID=UPI002B1F6EF2|nr:RNA methyltransferase [Propionicimonas sp.]MEA4945500.1 RNA methyltransferase [Propionicimonas sp.]MEA5052592.1 RNA methyltransferase [Propionicimonas sp.]MEA5117966.1 RNA methyltransferase [Propionicimonas sp.]